MKILSSVWKAVGIVLMLYAIYFGVTILWANASYQELRKGFQAEVIVLPADFEKDLLRIEDPRFYQHHGVDISLGQGATTITSIVARDFFLYGSSLTGIKGGLQNFYRVVFDCCKQFDVSRDVMALVLDKKLSKSEQLSAFLYRSYWGAMSGAALMGIQTASSVYFEKPLHKLNRKEFIILVAMLKAPDVYNPVSNPAALQRRVNRIENLLADKCISSGWFDTDYPNCDFH